MSRMQTSLVVFPALALIMSSAYLTHHVVHSGWASETSGGVDIVIAARDLQAGTALSGPDLIVTKIAASTAPLHCFHDTSTLLGHTMLLPVPKGDVIFPYEVGGDGDPILSPGMRAVRLEITRATDLQEDVQRGAQVDLLTAPNSRAGQKKHLTTVLKGVTVLSVTRNSEQASSGSGAVVMLLLSADDALRLAIAKSTGRMQITRAVRASPKAVRP